MSPAALGTALRAVLGSTGAVVDELQTLDGAIRTGLPLSRRIGFAAIAGGSGTTTTAAQVAAVLAARRTGPVLMVDADGGPAGLGRQVDAGPRPEPADWAEHADRRRTARTAALARSGLPRIVDGLHLLDLGAATPPAPAGSGRPSRSVADWTDQLAPIARFQDLVITDWGVRPAAEDLVPAALTGHVLVLVSRAGRQASAAAADVVAALQTLPQPPRLLLALVDVDRTSTPDRVATALQRSLEVRVHRLPYDPGAGAGWLSAAARPGFGSRRAVARLAAAVVTEAVTGPAPGRLAAVPADGARRTGPAGVVGPV